MGVYKLVARYTHNKIVPSWIRGKPGCQAKKRVYTSKEDFDNYAPLTAKRYNEFCHYDVEFYEKCKDEWIRFMPDWWRKKGAEVTG